MKKLVSLLLVLSMTIFASVGCSQKPAEQPATEVPPTEAVDAVTTASIVNEEAAFINATSKDGTWIIAILNDLSIDKELVLEGEFHDKADATKDLYRKIALYAQDADHKVTARYTLTAPKLTIKSPNAKIQGGTFKGDVYVEANGFTVQDATVEGNIYFASQEYKDSSVIVAEAGKEGKVTGNMEVQAVDAVTSASLVNEEAAFINAISKDGTWIIATLNDLSIDKELVLEGEFHDKADATKDLYRKIALYAQDADHKVTARYTLTAPKLTIKSPNAKIQGGTFKGDVYVEANGFTVQDATIDGNIYFASQEYKDSCVIAADAGKEGKVTGNMEVK